MLGKALTTAAAGNAAGEGLYVEEVFSTYLYTGNGSTQTITNGIDLDGEGGMVWFKARNQTGNHAVFNTIRGGTAFLTPNGSDGETYRSNLINSFNSDGFTLGNGDIYGITNYSSAYNFASWTFRKQPKFFDVVTYTGNRDAGTPTAIPHNLGSVPGCIIVKKASGTANWIVYHRNDGTTSKQGWLNLTNTFQNNGASFFTTTAPTDTNFYVGTDGDINENGQTYIAYLFAHNDGDGDFGESGDQDIIKSGSFNYTGFPQTVDIGFEPQWLLVKQSDGTGDWSMFDTMRGFTTQSGGTSGVGEQLLANTNGAATASARLYYGNASGFNLNLPAQGNYIYIAIRRGPMKTPESGTEVFNVTERTAGDPNHKAGFPVDMFIRKYNAENDIGSRLQGTNVLRTESTAAELTGYDYHLDQMTGIQAGQAANTGIHAWMFRRAPSFFDVVAYTGDGVAGRTVNHNLGVVPEMMIFKRRDGAIDWIIYHTGIGTDPTEEVVEFTSDALRSSTAFFNSTAPTSSVFSVGTASHTNYNTNTYIAYLFATLPGVSKVFSVTKSSGSNATVDCGFSAGARFVMLKRTDSTGDWYVWDTERGIVAGDDPYFLLNSIAAEVTNTDYIDPDSSGFVIVDNGLADGDYIGLAIA
jgi:hypothetical protein